MPDSWKDVLDAFPLLFRAMSAITICLPVHNEFQDRVKSACGRLDGWIRNSIYMVIGPLDPRMVTVEWNRARQCFVGLSDDDPSCWWVACVWPLPLH
jgi:hypothetical protein